MIAVNWKPDRRQLRGFAAACVIVLGALGAWLFLRHRFAGLDLTEGASRITAFVLWSIAGISAVLGVVAPGALRPLYVALTAASLPIGIGLSFVLMVLVFYGVLTPIGLVFRLVGRDPLQRKFDPGRDTYWVPCHKVRDAAEYFRQF